MNEVRVTGKSYEEALTNALLQLKTTSDRIDVTVVEQGSSGFLGFIGSRPWVIAAKLKEGFDPEAELKAAAADAVKTAAKPEEKPAEKPARTEKKPEAAPKAEKKPEALAPKTEKKPEAAPKQEKKAVKADPAENAGQAERAEKPEKKQRPERKDRPEKKERAEGEERRNGKGDRPERKERPQKQDSRKAEGKEPEVHEEVSEAEAQELIGRAETFLQDVFKVMDMNVELTSVFDHTENEIGITFAGDDMGVLIGKRGQTLDSLQYLVSLVVNKHRSGYIRVKLDTENYRDRRKEKLEELASNIAKKVKRTRRKVELEPMNPYERRIIHSALQSDPFVTTISEGEEPYRHIVVIPKRDNTRRRNNNGRRGPRRDRPEGRGEEMELQNSPAAEPQAFAASADPAPAAAPAPAENVPAPAPAERPAAQAPENTAE